MGEAFLWGAVGASALLVGSLISYSFKPSQRVIAVVMALGTGILIGSVSFELIDEALKTRTVGWIALLLLIGAGVFTVGSWVIDRSGGAERQDPTGKQSGGDPLAIVLGSVLDGIPESFVLGLTVIQGAVSIPLLAGVVLSNLPEGMASSSGLRAAGWPRKRVVIMWLLVALVSAISAAAGFVLLDPASGRTGALVQAFAAGALLAMLADTLLPEAYEVEGVLTGPLVAAGFAIAIALAAI